VRGQQPAGRLAAGGERAGYAGVEVEGAEVLVGVQQEVHHAAHSELVGPGSVGGPALLLAGEVGDAEDPLTV
jgi:hypothetical protein